MKKIWFHLIPFFLLFGLMAPIAGVRHVWQDEIETAERARSILSGAVPRVVDPEGRLSLNAAGREIEDGELHRYSPWGQFYVGAAGLAIGRAIGLSDDSSVRIGFIVTHAATSSMVSYGLATVCAWPISAAMIAGTALGFQSTRILHNRSARYHGVLDFLFLLGLLLIGLRSKFPNRTRWVFAFVVFLLPQFHTLGGGLLASTLVLAWYAVQEPKKTLREFFVERWRSLSADFAFTLAPLLLSVFVIGVLCRPWAQGAWAPLVDVARPWSLKRTLEIGYSFYVFGVGLIFICFKLRRQAFVFLAPVVLVAVYMLLMVRILDLYPFSQVRYYLSVPLYFLFWPLAFGWPKKAMSSKAGGLMFYVIAIIGIISPDLQGIIKPWQGIRILASDYQMKVSGVRQPLQSAMLEIESLGGARQSILVDYVPQFANWYLRSAPIALMPDSAGMTRLNKDQPWFHQARVAPEWHLFFEGQDGSWICSPHCDTHRVAISKDRYNLVYSEPTGEQKKIEFCVVKSWPVNRWNNAPFVSYNELATKPEGPAEDTLTLARKCSK